MDVDVAIVGGSFAGLSAALFLANSLRNVVVIDAGNPANAPAQQMHNLIGNEGVPPLVFLANVKQQLQVYQNLSLQTDIVTAITKQSDHNFLITTTQTSINAKKVILTTGIRHVLPEIKNISEYWVHNIFHCPYCFGSEFINQPLGIYCTSGKALDQVLLMKKYSNDFILLTNGCYVFSKREKKIIESFNIPIYAEKISFLSGKPGESIIIHFEDGTQVSRRGIFLHPMLLQPNPDLIQQLNLKCTASSLLKVNHRYETNIKGVFAAGDGACEIQKVPTAIASGSSAAFYVDSDLSKLY